jgi:hypothetical protein
MFNFYTYIYTILISNPGLKGPTGQTFFCLAQPKYSISVFKIPPVLSSILDYLPRKFCINLFPRFSSSSVSEFKGTASPDIEFCWRVFLIKSILSEGPLMFSDFCVLYLLRYYQIYLVPASMKNA